MTIAVRGPSDGGCLRAFCSFHFSVIRAIECRSASIFNISTLHQLYIWKMEDRGPELAVTVILFLILSWLIVTLRCLVRLRMIKSFGLDDWFMIATLVSTILPGQ